MEWFRWHNDTTIDAKWRMVARRTGQPVAHVVAVWAALGEHANQADDRGTAEKWDAEVVAATLDLDASQVEAIVEAMQGRVLDGLRLTGWEKRNPKREDPTALERQRRKRERESEDVTQCHAPVTQETVTPLAREEEEEEREEEKESSSSVLKLNARDALEDQANEIIRLANRGMADNPAIGNACNPIPPGHGSRSTVLEWLTDGVPPDVAGRAVYQRAKEYQPDGRRRQVTTMRYFDGAVRDEHDRQRAKDTPAPKSDERGNGAAAQRNGTTGRPAAAARIPAAGGDPSRRSGWVYEGG